MKCLMFLWMMMLLDIGLSVSSHAALIDMENESGHVVYDDLSGRYWMWDLLAYTNMTYDEQISAISNMNAGGDPYYGLDGWHMATLGEMQLLSRYSGSDITSSFNPSYVSIWIYFEGRYDEVSTPGSHYSARSAISDTGHIYDMFLTNVLPDIGEFSIVGAWAVTNVPIPSAFLLFGSGLIGLVGIRRKLKGSQNHEEGANEKELGVVIGNGVFIDVIQYSKCSPYCNWNSTV